MNDAQRDFIRRLNEYQSAWTRGDPSAIGNILRTIDTPNRRRRYLSTHDTPSIDDYIDFAYDERSRAL